MTIEVNGWKINNAPENALAHAYIVFRVIDGEAWFYDAWNNEGKALAQADDIGGRCAATR